MTRADLAAVAHIAAEVHPDYPEDAAVFEERLRLYPAGCHVHAAGAAITGYILSHPWLDRQPPALNTLLGAIPANADTYYIHDIALLRQSRGQDAARAILNQIIALARQSGFKNLSLIAVNGSAVFWRKHGFEIVQDAALDEKLKSYDAQARFMRLDLSTRHGDT
ncbi:MAG TPA: GNAT family N-acetyltransferase [Pseudolabrys sp.]|nr:GNAT family N-acetyltransferase [Pseudolabrys sp.]